ncbi:MAG: fasciclin domain-containing protein [Pseudomonadota bacterium]
MFTTIKTRRSVSLALAGLLAFASAYQPALAGHHEEKETTTSNIVETAAAAGSFGTLLAAAKAAGLADTLANGGPFTVFAPTDEAFEALPAGTVENLLKPENKTQLATILKFHVLAGKVGSGALADGIQVDTLAGIGAGIAASEGGFTIEGAKIVATDIAATNGVIHVIDRVILPPETMSQTRAPKLPAVDVIETAIDAGVPMFNHGNAQSTVAIYTVALKSLVNFSEAAGLSDATVTRIENSMRKAGMQRDAREQAWTLRYALDAARDSLTRGQMSAATGH